MINLKKNNLKQINFFLPNKLVFLKLHTFTYIGISKTNKNIHTFFKTIVLEIVQLFDGVE